MLGKFGEISNPRETDPYPRIYLCARWIALTAGVDLPGFPITRDADVHTLAARRGHDADYMWTVNNFKSILSTRGRDSRQEVNRQNKMWTYSSSVAFVILNRLLQLFFFAHINRNGHDIG